MSKMSQIHMDLCEQANDLGFSSIEEAEANGYHIAYNNTGWKLSLNMAKAYEQAHEAWLEERDTLLKNLEEQEEFARESYEVDHTVIRHAIEFIRKGEC